MAGRIVKKPPKFNIVSVVHSGRLAYEALLLAASLRHTNPNFAGQLLLAEPRPGPKWDTDPRLPDGPLRERLLELGAKFVEFDSKIYGQAYAIGNKIECLEALPDEPFLFLDTDTLIRGSFDQIQFNFAKPAASMRREATWPEIELYGPNHNEIWGSLYRKFDLDFDSSLDLSHPDDYWQRYLYFNAGWFFYKSPKSFGERWAKWSKAISDAAPPELICQELWPWLDQISLPLVVHSFGGGRPGAELAGLDGAVTCHYRSLALIYAREDQQTIDLLELLAKDKPNRRLLRDWDAAKQLIYHNRGRKARALFDQSDLPTREKPIRNMLKRAGYWLR